MVDEEGTGRIHSKKMQYIASGMYYLLEWREGCLEYERYYYFSGYGILREMALGKSCAVVNKAKAKPGNEKVINARPNHWTISPK